MIPGYELEWAYIEKCRRGGHMPCERCGRYCKANPLGLCYYCRTGRPSPTSWSKCLVCGRKCIGKPDGLCGQCRKGHVPVEWDDCSQCGRRCHRNDDGLCSVCRRLTPAGRKRHREQSKRNRLNQERNRQ